ncbi:hypothetical protein BG000_005066 [Podila horticola]|nr:hypothetical protein BG000_005066 [Podila horticola]
MACTSGFGTVVPAASLTGDPTTWSVVWDRSSDTVCVMHTLGPSGDCMFEPGYKKGCCCSRSLTESYEMPLLGFNTTAGVYLTCDGGVIPDFPQPTGTSSLPSPASSSPVATPTPSTTTAAAVSPTPTKSSANKNNTGMVLLLIMFTTMIL